MSEVTSSISRLVAFIVAPVIAVVVPIIVYWAQDVAGVDLDADQLAILLTGVVVSLGGVIFKWLDGRSSFEVAEVQAGPTGYEEVEPEEPETLKPAS